ncbi:hypothetical protein WSM22_04480 [Cytophagales bacterium WSM2-2]|nr:hypothetical protein WSM22_04480 [Cytophagales bacterium WSM2-2]
MELIIHYGDPYLQFLEDGSQIIQPRSFVFGQITSPLVIAPTGASGIVAARFLPEGFAPFSTMPAGEMHNRAVPLQELYGKDGLLLEKTVLASSLIEERIEIISNFLSQRLETTSGCDALAKETFNLLMHSKGQISVDSLVTRLQTSRRQLERKLSSTIGLSPKQLSRIVRLQSVLKLMEKKQYSSLTELALEGGYFDQAHFIKDFKEFTGVSPKQFYADNMKMSALFISEE